jgi:hypothetical protein
VKNNGSRRALFIPVGYSLEVTRAREVDSIKNYRKMGRAWREDGGGGGGVVYRSLSHHNRQHCCSATRVICLLLLLAYILVRRIHCIVYVKEGALNLFLVKNQIFFFRKTIQTAVKK